MLSFDWLVMLRMSWGICSVVIGSVSYMLGAMMLQLLGFHRHSCVLRMAWGGMVLIGPSPQELGNRCHVMFACGVIMTAMCMPLGCCTYLMFLCATSDGLPHSMDEDEDSQTRKRPLLRSAHTHTHTLPPPLPTSIAHLTHTHIPSHCNSVVQWVYLVCTH